MEWLRVPHLLYFSSRAIEAPGFFRIPTSFCGRHVSFCFISLKLYKELSSNQNDDVAIPAKPRICDAKSALLLLTILKSCFQIGLVHHTCRAIDGEYLLRVRRIRAVLPQFGFSQ